MCACVSGGASVRSAGQRHAVSGPAVARDGPQHLQGPPEVHRHLLHTLPWSVCACVCVHVLTVCVSAAVVSLRLLFHRGRGAPLRSRLLPDHGTDGRRHQRQRSPSRDGGDRGRSGETHFLSLSAFPVCGEFDCRCSAGRTPGHSRVSRHWLPARHQG